ncbi:MerR family transcriptional regulator [Celeribacter neptunius]|nr:MerR family transcriptional regulator [Celeribacter neptunius]
MEEQLICPENGWRATGRHPIKFAMKMRDLETETGVNRETIRVYFRYGLLPEPVRPKPNVADYDQSHVEAIRAVRDLQKKSGMTLPQIRDFLSGKQIERGLDAHAFQSLETLLASRVEYDGSGHVSLESLSEQNPFSFSDAHLMANKGLVTLLEGRNGPMLSLSDARMLGIWQKMREAGFDEAHGFSVDILDYYRHAAEYVATHESHLFRERVEGRINEQKAVDMLEQALPLMLEFFGLLRLKSFLAKIGPDFAIVQDKEDA